MDISPVFNVEDLLSYQGTFEPSTLSSSVSAGEASKGAVTPPTRHLKWVSSEGVTL